MGFGDVKMIAMIGAFMGLRAALLTLIVASLLGSIVGFVYIRVTKQDTSTYELPFGSFLGFAALVVAVLTFPREVHSIGSVMATVAGWWA